MALSQDKSRSILHTAGMSYIGLRYHSLHYLECKHGAILAVTILYYCQPRMSMSISAPSLCNGLMVSFTRRASSMNSR